MSKVIVTTKAYKAYWRHRASGEIFAVKWQCDHCAEACGPLHYLDVRRDNLEDWDFENDPELAEDIGRFSDDYDLYAEDFWYEPDLTPAELQERREDDAYHAAKEDGLI